MHVPGRVSQNPSIKTYHHSAKAYHPELGTKVSVLKGKNWSFSWLNGIKKNSQKDYGYKNLEKILSIPERGYKRDKIQILRKRKLCHPLEYTHNIATCCVAQRMGKSCC